MSRPKDFIDQLDRPGWATWEFELAPLMDRRLNRRAAIMARDFARHPGAPIPQACGTRSKTTAAYRFVENDFVRPQQMLIGHRQASLRRWAHEPVVLAPSDTTSLNYSSHPQTRGLGNIGSKKVPKAQGLFLHSTLTFTPAGLPLGLVAARFWARTKNSAHQPDRYHRPFRQKESARWWESWKACRGALVQLPRPNLWVNIADMEADIYEVFAAAQAQPDPRVELLVRSRHDRKLDAQEQRLWQSLASQPLADTMQVRVPRHGKSPARLASLQIRFSEMWLRAPRRKAGQGSLHLWAVEAREVAAPQGVELILWRLLSSLALSSAQEACQKVRWYAVRWCIEVFHKILKSVCHAEDPQVESAQRLERLLMIDLIVAWRIHVLTLVGRQNPDVAASELFGESEWKALYSYIHRDRSVPAQAPGLGQMMQWIGELGGFVKCKATPYPGSITLARGLARLDDLAQMWAIQNTIHAKVK
jgi:Transposase DNA-binding/Transposase Tn5 dimerisation domain